MARKLASIAKSVVPKLERAAVAPSVPKVVEKAPKVSGRLARIAKKELEKPGCEPVSFKLSTLRELLMIELEKDDGQNAKAVVRALVARAMEGDPYCIRMLMERVDGLMPKSLNITGQIAVGQVVTLVDTRQLGVELPAFVHANAFSRHAHVGEGSASPSQLPLLTPTVEETREEMHDNASESNLQLSSNSTMQTNLEGENLLGNSSTASSQSTG